MVGVGEMARAATVGSMGSVAGAGREGMDAGGAPFSGMMRAMMSESAGLEDKAQKAVTGLLNGSGVELHQVMIATQKADMAFELGLQVRNKAVAAYQQMMSMQF